MNLTTYLPDDQPQPTPAVTLPAQRCEQTTTGPLAFPCQRNAGHSGGCQYASIWVADRRDLLEGNVP